MYNNKLFMKILPLLILFTSICTQSYAKDILTLTGKKKFNGEILKIKDCLITFKMNDNTYKIPATNIFSIQFENAENKIYRKHLKKSLSSPEDVCLNANINDGSNNKDEVAIIKGVFFGPFANINAELIKSYKLKNSAPDINTGEKEIFSDPDYLKFYLK